MRRCIAPMILLATVAIAACGGGEGADTPSTTGALQASASMQAPASAASRASQQPGNETTGAASGYFVGSSGNAAKFHALVTESGQAYLLFGPDGGSDAFIDRIVVVEGSIGRARSFTGHGRLYHVAMENMAVKASLERNSGAMTVRLESEEAPTLSATASQVVEPASQGRPSSAGSFRGSLTMPNGEYQATLTINADGVTQGRTAAGCEFAGAVKQEGPGLLNIRLILGKACDSPGKILLGHGAIHQSTLRSVALDSTHETVAVFVGRR